MKNEIKDIWKYIIIVASIVLVAILGSIFVSLGLPWFQSVTKPNEFVPPIVFSIVWSSIYISFAIILCIIVDRDGIKPKSIVLLILNGVLNVLWCLLFFTINSTLLGLITIVLNLIIGIILLVHIYSRYPIFSYILSIYPIWLSLATALNLAIWILN